jgi:polysaccharide export outer membrane protein
MLSLAACSGLPSSGPSALSIQRQATVEVRTDKTDAGLNYALVDVSSAILPYFDSYQAESLQSLAGQGGPAPNFMFGFGDVVTVTIYESQPGGLFIPQSSNTAGNFVQLPQQTIDRQGNITVPYVGSVKIAGRPLTEVQNDIQKRLASKAIEPQVIISTADNRSDKVSVLGDVNTAAELPLNPAGERILDVIARAGGLSAPAIETSVTVERGSRHVTALFANIVTNAKENIYVRPGDTIYVNRERRTFLAFGASGVNGRFDFRESNLTLGEALGEAGGLLDNRADPSQVFLYRHVPRSVLQKAGVDTSQFTGDTIPVVFRADLRDPATFFAVQKFAMQDKDIIYVSNAPTTELAKFLSVINGVSNTATSVVINASDTKDALQNLAK